MYLLYLYHQLNFPNQVFINQCFDIITIIGNITFWDNSIYMVPK